LNTADPATDDHHVSKIAFKRGFFHLPSSFRVMWIS
jgi:hypothetical protein